MITTHHVTGDWRTITGDTPADPDPYPDELEPTGHIRLHPTDPGPHIADGVAHSISTVTALIAAGRLNDLQGRDGIWLATHIGDQPIEWEAHINLHWRGRHLEYTIRFTPTSDTHITETGVH